MNKQQSDIYFFARDKTLPEIAVLKQQLTKAGLTIKHQHLRKHQGS